MTLANIRKNYDFFPLILPDFDEKKKNIFAMTLVLLDVFLDGFSKYRLFIVEKYILIGHFRLNIPPDFACHPVDLAWAFLGTL